MTDFPRQSLAQSADPIALISDAGEIVWRNEAFTRLAARCDAPGPLSAKDLQKITATTHYAIYPVAMKSHGREETRSAVVIDVSSGDPGLGLFLVSLQSTLSEDAQVDIREQYLATVAHDLRNPIGAIFSYADALIDTNAGNGMTSPQRDILRKIRSTAARAVELILNYQLLSQFKIKGLLKPATTVDINATVRAVLEAAWREEGSSPAVTCELSPESPSIRIEKVHIERILSNLLHNAVKYTPPSGSIKVKTERTPQTVHITVTNTGVSIPDEELPRIFDRYQRASSSRGTGGSGLGLFIVKTITEANGGTVTVSSDPASGVCFTLRFPAL